MNPLVLLATSLIPKLFDYALRNDSAAKQVQSRVEKTITDVTGETSPEGVTEKLRANSKLEVDLRVRLAEIARDAERDERETARQAAAQADKMAAENTQDARGRLVELLDKSESKFISWTASVISYLVILGFLALLAVLLFRTPPTADNQFTQIINILVGALAAGFATVLNFWLGSSLGSRRKDAIETVRALTPRTDDAESPSPLPTSPYPKSTGPGEVAPRAAGPTAESPDDTPPVPRPSAPRGAGASTDPRTVNNRQDIPPGPDKTPASIRYNNPGAQYPSREAARFGQTGFGVIGGNHKIARFPSPVNGAAANLDLLHRTYTNMTMGEAGKKWTGSHGLGIPGYNDGIVLTKAMVEDETVAIKILKAIAKREAGKASPLTEDQWGHAHGMFLAGSADAYLGRFAIARSISEFVPENASPSVPLEGLIVRAMDRNGHPLDRAPGQINIVYVEGMNEDGSRNNDEANAFNDLRCVIGFDGNEPVMLGKWQATTEPGNYYTKVKILNRLGAARVEFGHYEAWRVGKHRNRQEALIQVANVTVCRDLNQDMIRLGDKCDTGLFGINQHGGYDQPADDIGKASAGCLVGRTMAGHAAFMKIVKSDPRYKADNDFIFRTTILEETDVLAELHDPGAS